MVGGSPPRRHHPDVTILNYVEFLHYQHDGDALKKEQPPKSGERINGSIFGMICKRDSLPVIDDVLPRDD